ncbi:MAG: hypothetical protein ACP5PJ_07385 [Acidimicrobiales bacterium]
MEDFQRHSQRIRSIALRVAFTLVIAAIVVVVIVLKLRHANSTSANGSTSITITQVAPAGNKRGAPPASFRSVAFDPVNANLWWILGVVPCHGAQCAEFAVTYDGGASYQAVPAPSLPLTTSAEVGALRQSFGFANATDGYAAIGGTLYLTTDGGAHWIAAGVSSTVYSLALGTNRAYVATTSSAGTIAELSAPIGTTTWSALSRSGNYLVAAGHDLWIGTFGGNGAIATLAYSANDGTTFQSVSVPSGVSCHILSAGGPIWTTCNEGTNLTLAYASTPTAAPTTVTAPGALCPGSSELVPTSTSDALLSCENPGSPVESTNDVGGHWHQVLAPLSSNGHWRLLGSPTDQRVVLAGWEPSQDSTSLAEVSAFVFSADGGSSWSRVDVPTFTPLLLSP